MTGRALPLARFTVLDLTRVRAGPTCARYFADWGADVIKIESPPGLLEDDGYTGSRHNSDFQNLHRNKRAMTLNFKEPDGKAIFAKLVADVDVVIENFRPDVKDRLGIAYEDLKAINPRIVLGSISGFGQTGPYAGRPGVDQIAQGMGGFMSVTGLPGQGPVRAGTAIADIASGMNCAIGILIALLEREVSGEGQWVQSSLLESQIALMDFQCTRWLMDGEVPPQAGNNHPKSTPTGVFETADGHINISAGGQLRWKRFCGALGEPGKALFGNADYATGDGRFQHRDALNDEIGAITRTRTSAEWVDAFNEAGVPAGPIYSVDQTFADPQVKHLGIAKPVHHPALGDISLVGSPVALSGASAALRTATPELGEHTDSILVALGYSADAIADLRERGVI